MQLDSEFPDWLYFQTKQYHFSLTWNELPVLRIEAGKKTDPTLCFVGELRSEQLDKGTSIKTLLQFLKEKELKSSLSKADQLSFIVTIIDQTQEGKGYYCRLMYGDRIKSVKVEPIKVTQTYFLTKKIEALQYTNKTNRLVLADYNNEITKKIEEKDYAINKVFSDNIEGIVSAITNRLQKKFEEKSKEQKNNNEITGLQDVFEEGGISLKKIQKKIRKKIKKELKQKKKQKRQKRRQKEKRRKQKRKQRKEKEKLGQQQNNGEILPNQNNQPINLESIQIKQGENGILHENQVILDIDNNNILNIDEPQQTGQHHKKKKKKEKHKKEAKKQKSDLHFKPNVTSLDGMNKLRARDFFPIMNKPIQIIEDTAQSKHKKEKKSKQKKKHKPKEENKVNENDQVQEQGQKEYYRRLDEIRKTGGIDQARIIKANRNKPNLAPPKPPLLQVDEFNPQYNGQPKYKPFVNINDGHAMRPGQIFGSHRLAQTTAQYKRIPIIFREEIPTFKNFNVNGCIVRKTQGLNYQQLVFDYPIPTSGKYILTMRIIQSKRMHLWYGVIDIREKDRPESYNKKSTIAYSLRTGHIATSTKWSRSKTGELSVGLAIRMEIDMDQSSITFRISDGRINSCPIPKLFKKQTLVPYFQMMDPGDQVCFQQ